ncbi:MAG: undecaprenyl-phosphate glucose phosphotransferase [Ignavibacteria bacterium]
MQMQRKFVHTSRMTADLLFLILSFIGARAASRDYKLLSLDFFDITSIIVLGFVWFFSSRITGLYDEFRSCNFSFEFISLIKNVLAQSLAAIVFIFFIKELSLSRMFIINYSLFLITSVSIEKYVIRRLLERYRQKGRNQRNVLIIGAGPVGRKFYDSIHNNSHFGYKFIGFLDDDKKVPLNGKYLGKIDLIEYMLENKHIDDVIIALPNYAADKIEHVITTCQRYTARVRIIPDYFKFFSHKYSVSMFGSFPIISVRDDRLNELHWRLLKRAFDTGFTLLLFILLFWWLWPVIALAIKLTSKGPVYFKQERWGRNNRKFIAIKFRSMSDTSKDVDEKGKYNQATKDDPRITAVGKILRKTNFDELPQFINVLRGDMSVVGPRPHPIPLNMESKDSIKDYMLRHLVKPGITGWAQVNGYRGETKDSCKMQKRVEHDLWYIEHWSFWLDIQIIFLTVWHMIKGDPNAY